MTTAQDGCKVVSLTRRPLLPQEIILILISVRGCVDLRALLRLEGFYVKEKSQMTPAGIEPATFRFVAQHLNHRTTAFSTTNSTEITILLNSSRHEFENILKRLFDRCCRQRPMFLYTIGFVVSRVPLSNKKGPLCLSHVSARPSVRMYHRVSLSLSLSERIFLKYLRLLFKIVSR